MPTFRQVGVMMRDSRVALRTLTIASAAAILLCTTYVQAGIVNLVVDPSLSSLTIGGNITLVGDGDPIVIPILPQGPGGDTASYSGTMSIDLGTGTIQLLPGASIAAAITGNWAPEDLGPGVDPTGGTGPANYGVKVGNIVNGKIAYNSLVLDFASGTPMALSGTNFDLTGQNMAFTSGRQVLTSNLGASEGSVIGFPTIFSTGGVNDVGNWDGNTLTIPVHSSYTYLVTNDPFVVNSTVTFTGQLVARVPEPSSLILGGLGLIGLVGFGYRARKHKA